MFEVSLDIIEAFERVSDAEPSARQNMVIMYVATVAGAVVYWAILGFVVWSLGKRMIQAAFAGWRESRRGHA